MNRRKVLSWLTLSWISGIVSVVIGACTNRTSTSSTPAPKAEATPGGFIKVGQTQDLDKNGRILQTLKGNQKVLVVRDPKNADTLHALNPTCTHQGCPVDWKQDSQDIFCACHGSTYTPDGAVAKGPASEPLESYDIKVEGDAILVKPQAS
ncbi:QcrA and Rieske domain-containing protein [Acaryochloris marina]|uniref:Short putative Rieske iron sulfur protein n=1 Tax=Acaryochloris marina (strain MBIC 11017) TaxID=329726 RepID=B0CEL2_ACAM1|nr:ubiquinol-cytochrome c reductase iron-sulfur subunit [Acaryochloris marina]ABW26978.1 short putative Rieske iron sulfur protein [Acaryochloris marina MBIC11017]BDM81745.1 Rieske iron-sulfur protein [Acaryochloris marina MBIC10699]